MVIRNQWYEWPNVIRFDTPIPLELKDVPHLDEKTGSIDDLFESMINRQLEEEQKAMQLISPMLIQNEYREEIHWPDVTANPDKEVLSLLKKIRGDHVKSFRTICRIHSDDKGFMESIHHDDVTNRQYLAMLTEREEWFDAALAKLSTL